VVRAGGGNTLTPSTMTGVNRFKELYLRGAATASIAAPDSNSCSSKTAVLPSDRHDHTVAKNLCRWALTHVCCHSHRDVQSRKPDEREAHIRRVQNRDRRQLPGLGRREGWKLQDARPLRTDKDHNHDVDAGEALAPGEAHKVSVGCSHQQRALRVATRRGAHPQWLHDQDGGDHLQQQHGVGQSEVHERRLVDEVHRDCSDTCISCAVR